jgi:hypothetical protein
VGVNLSIMKIQLFGLLLLLSGPASIITLAQTAPAKPAVKIATYKTFAEQKTTFGYHKSGTRTYKIRKIPTSAISYGEPQEMERPATARAVRSSSGPYYPNAQKCNGDVFAGVDRAQAKTHEVTGGTDTSFTGFDAFYNSGLLTADAEMTQYNPPITKKPESPRVKEELFNISIDTVYIYGIYREDDNDFHMIIGNGRTGSAMRLLNAEVSGLPGDTDDHLLTAVREKIKARFGDITCKDGAFKPVGTLIPIQISGSLFFDIDHKAGVVGFGVYKPTTAWELHPITGIVFLDE